MFSAGKLHFLAEGGNTTVAMDWGKFYFIYFLPPTFLNMHMEHTTTKTLIVMHGGMVVLLGMEPVLWNI